MTHIFTDSSFETEVLQSDVPVLVDFWGEGCGGCRQIAPVIDAVAGAYAGKVKVGKLDVMEHSQTAMRYHIRSIPTLLVFRRGEVVAQRIGAMGKAEVEKMLGAVM